MLERIYNRVAPYLKAYVAALVPGFVVAASVVVDAALLEVDPIVAAVVVGVLTPLGVYVAPNQRPAKEPVL